MFGRSTVGGIVSASTAVVYLICSLSQAGDMQVNVRPAAAARMGFYPGDPTRLRKTVEAFLVDVPDREPGGRILAALAPHAGYAYSGSVAAYTHKALAATDFDTIVIIGHDTGIRDVVAFISPADYYETPLGRVEVDRIFSDRLIESGDGIRSREFAEHSVEVQLPFLQVARTNEFKIVPVIFGNPTVDNCRAFAKAIDTAAGGDTKALILASTDMSHYPPYEQARDLDKSTLSALESMDTHALFGHLERQERRGIFDGVETAMCSRGGVGTALFFAVAHGADRAEILKYANSGDVSMGDRKRVVGYCSVLLVDSGED